MRMVWDPVSIFNFHTEAELAVWRAALVTNMYGHEYWFALLTRAALHTAKSASVSKNKMQLLAKLYLSCC